MTRPPDRLPQSAKEQEYRTAITRGDASSAPGRTAYARASRDSIAPEARAYASPTQITQYAQLSASDDNNAHFPAVLSIPLLGSEAIADGFASVQSASTGPVVVAAAGTVAVVGYTIPIALTLWSCALVVSNAAGTQRLVVSLTSAVDLGLTHVAASLSTTDFPEWVVDATQTVGTDLTLNSSGRVKSTAGGVFTSLLYVAVRATDA